MKQAVLLMIVGMSLIPLGDSAAKLLTGSGAVAPVFVGWVRFGLGALLIFPFVPAKHQVARVFLDWRIIMRGCLIVAGITSILTALQTAPLPSVFGAFFVGPIVSYGLSAWLLREPVTWVRTVLLRLGFVGVMMIVQPGPTMPEGIGFALLSGCFYGAFLTTGRWLAEVARPRHLLFSQLALGGVILAPVGLMNIPQFTLPITGLLLVSTIASMLGNLLLILAYRLAPATRMAPLVYVQLIAASLYGWVIFADRPNLLTWAGLTVLIATGFATFLKPGLIQRSR